ncbi:MAG: hypothetical protein AAF288_01475 [Planctomycetota bacterium]
MTAGDIALVLTAAAGWYLVGLIWFVQRTHYPMMRWGPADRFAEFEQEHMRRTGPVTGPVMLVELSSALWLCFAGTLGVPTWALWLSVGLSAGVFGLTAIVFVPLHKRLCAGRDDAALRSLVRWNGLRTAMWTARAVLLAWMLLARLSAGPAV